MKYIEKDTIVALATPLGRGAIAVVRLSGQDSLAIVNRLLVRKIGKADVRRAVFSDLIAADSGELIDQVVVTYFQAPASYTGEDVVEISCHCNPLIIDRIISQAVQQGARVAEPGEFTFRAFLNHKLDLSQAEAVAEVIDARTSQSLKQSLHHLEGRLSEKIAAIKNELLDCLSLLEISLDFSEEDLEIIPPEQLRERLTRVVNRIQSFLKTYAYGRLLENGARLLIIGKPNVGKSSLLNLLLGKERAIVSDLPGTTRDYIEAGMQLDGIYIQAVDTAGVRQTRDQVESMGIQRTLELLKTADVALAMFEGHRALDADDQEMLRIIQAHCKETPFVLVVNKADLGVREEALEPLRALELPLVTLSVKEERGLDALKAAIRKALIQEDVGDSEEVVITSARHRAVLEAVVEALGNALQSLQQGAPEEVVALDVRVALDRLGEITGETTPEDVLRHIFSNFCIGK
ncbi:MAG: tRNA uridine-5-carboxymethylaminomethyl(34) synthesis GTPase MnmE [Calditrichaeota bacterium]|nr:tRNA uridine-5-carboxymethylaminomethyl(34) synthesis GTPase MnmE [Calditrichota bacterium]